MILPVTPLSNPALPITPGVPPEGAAPTGPSPFAQMLQQRQSAPPASQGTGPSQPGSQAASTQATGSKAPAQAAESKAPATTQPEGQGQTAAARETADEASTGRAGPRGGKAGAASPRLGRKALDGLMDARGKDVREAKGKDGSKKTEAASTDPSATPAWPMPLPGAPAALARLAEAARQAPAEGDGPAQIGAVRTAAVAQPGTDAQATALPAGADNAAKDSLLRHDEATATPLRPGDAAKAGSIEAAGQAFRGERTDGAGRDRQGARTDTPEDGTSFDKQLASLLGQDGRTARVDAPERERDTDRGALAATPGNAAAFAAHLPSTPADTREGLRGPSEAKVGSVGETPGLMPHAMPATVPLNPTADVAAPALAVATPVQSPEFSQALATQVSVLARDGVQEASLQLNPAELGPISVHIAMDGTQARVEFAVDSAVTRQVIEAGLPELASALREAGLTLSGGGVSQQNSPSAQQQETFSRQGRDNGPAQQGRQDGNEPGGAQGPRRHISVSQGGLDLYA